MMKNILQIVLAIFIILILFSIVKWVLHFTINTLLPIAVLVIAGYIVYKVVTRR